MAISTLFFIFLGVMVFGLLCAALNMILTFRKASKPGGINYGTISGGIVWHMISGAIAGIGSLGSLITGIVWIVQTIKA
jgi:hypothetical protein